jgi:hypothetical protein
MELSDNNGQEVSLDKLGLTQLDWTVDEILDESETPDDWKDTNLYNVEGEDYITVSGLLSPEAKHEHKVKIVTKIFNEMLEEIRIEYPANIIRVAEVFYSLSEILLEKKVKNGLYRNQVENALQKILDAKCNMNQNELLMIISKILFENK